jgi:transposase
MRTLRLKVKAESYPWLAAAAVEVNQVFNWANATSIDAADRNRRANAKFLSGFDLCYLSAGATERFEHIGAATIQRICGEYAAKRRAAKRVRLRWRVSGSLSGPQGVNGLRVRSWICSECGDSHDRDVNAARVILLRGEVSPSVRGNESSPKRRQPSQT